MTREDAIKILNQTFRNIVTDVHYSANDIDKALAMAIDALSTPALPEELEEAAERYADGPECTWVGTTALEYAFIAGAKWQREQFEKNRLAACDKMAEEEYNRETDFAVKYIEEHHRQPTFSNAIEYGMELQKQQMLEGAVEGVAEELYCDDEIHCVVGVGSYFKPGEEVYVIKKEDVE